MLSIVIPFFNESENVTVVAQGLLAALKRSGIAHELVLVDNGSHDDTRQRIEAVVQAHPEARLVVVERNLGYGWGILQGLRHARGDVLGYIMGDGQVESGSVAQVYQKLAAEALEFCKGTRVVRHDGWQRRLLTRWANRAFRWCFPSLKTSDINGGPKLFTRRLFDRLHLVSKDWFLDAELVIKASRAGVPMGELAVESPPRQSGRSHVRWSTVAQFLWNLARYRLGGALAQREQG
jgi:glycosyltransferase involved in cell wall biosynthesis